MTWRDYYHLCIILTVEMLLVDTLAGFTDACIPEKVCTRRARAYFLIYYRRNGNLHGKESLNSTKSLSTFFLATFFFFPAPCTKKKYSGPGDRWYLSACYGFHTHQPLHMLPPHPPPPPPPPSLVSSHLIPSLMRCFAHELRLPTCSVLARTSRGQATSGCYGGGYEAPQDPEGLGQDGDCNQQNRCWWRNGLLWDFFFFFSPEKNLPIRAIYEAGRNNDHDDGDWMVYELLAGKNMFGHLAPKILHLPE